MESFQTRSDESTDLPMLDSPRYFYSSLDEIRLYCMKSIYLKYFRDGIIFFHAFYFA